jgi:hypothetical protein
MDKTDVRRETREADNCEVILMSSKVSLNVKSQSEPFREEGERK